MDDRPHLPIAAGLPDLSALRQFEDRSLSGMADECARWLRNTSECRASIVTPAAKTLWAVLVQGEVDHVARTHGRLLREIASRSRPGGRDGA
ncbi:MULTISPECIES: hypothetical protein [unclassified Aureimonas]|uniref:hypothetical protein n=1 Tax=unclassified Aureimonas TaxID=2615206 RepID=UPI00070A6654|nr:MULTISPECIES: hypothetical protein [unclassified Aureimonas]KQT69272.1 hypothetical protein ASG62_17735 [Aureimonas sp. Leaf427]